MNHVVGRIQERYGVAKAEAEKQAGEWSRAPRQSERESPATRLKKSTHPDRQD